VQIRIGDSPVVTKSSMSEEAERQLMLMRTGSCPFRRALREGLFLVELSKVTIARETWSYQEPALSTAIPVATFHNNPLDEEPMMPEGLRPEAHGLNDCTHFTSQCLLAGGLSSSLASIDAREFFDKLYASSATKTLARIVPRAQAVPIIDANTSPFKKGDVLIYSDSGGRCSHAVIHLERRPI
jgi:hypothetical protein